MANIIKLIAFLALSIIVSSTIFSLWIGLYWFIYEKLYGPFRIGEGFLLVFYVKNPFLIALIPGILIGIVYGFITSLIINFYESSNLLKGVLIGAITMIVLILGGYFISKLLDNPFGVFFDIFYEYDLILKFIATFLFPSILLGFLIMFLKLKIYKI